MINICVGIVGDQQGWKYLLEQEGIPHAAADTTLSPDRYSALVVSDGIDAVTLARVKQYLVRGGAVLCSGKVYSALERSPFQESFVKYIVDEPGSCFPGIGLIDLQHRCCIPAAAADLKTNKDEHAVVLEEFGKGYLVALPFDADKLVCDVRVTRKSFYAQRMRLPFERVSAVSRAGIRTLVARSLELLHHRRGLPYLHVWYYPTNAQTIFSFRVDTDFASASEIDGLYAVAQKFSLPFTWFVHVKAQEEFLEQFSNMDGHEIGVHCYDHVVYDDIEQNALNIRTAMKMLESAGCSPKGIAAPYGTWTNEVARAIQQFGFEYSSEFSYDYDNLPSNPLMTDRQRMALQVPVHPISIGSLRRQSFTSEEMTSYFMDVVKRKIQRRDPLFFYHHPKNNHHEVLETIFKFVQEQQIPVMRMIDVARWWKQRECCMPVVKYDGSALHVDIPHTDERVWLHVTRKDGEECFSPMNRSIGMNSVEWKPSPLPVPLPEDISRSRRFNPYIIINRIEDAVNKRLFPRT